MQKDKKVVIQINQFMDKFIKMKVKGITIQCPYWMNKIKNGKVTVRGFLDGKGSAINIQKELERVVGLKNNIKITKDRIIKLAKRSRIGLDCSGFVYQVLEKLISLYKEELRINNLKEIYTEGIRRTNTRMLTSTYFCIPIKDITYLKTGDLIRIMSGKHVMIIIEKNKTEIIYAHSSRSTAFQGVHLGKIRIIDEKLPLEKQIWLEKTRKGENFGDKYYHPEQNDQIYRLKIFDKNE